MKGYDGGTGLISVKTWTSENPAQAIKLQTYPGVLWPETWPEDPLYDLSLLSSAPVNKYLNIV
jgi:hypothetical protein